MYSLHKNKYETQLIIEKYLEGRATGSEMKDLLEWLRKKENRIVFHTFKLDWKHSLGKDSIPDESRDSWSRLQEQLAQKSFTRFSESRRLQFISKVELPDGSMVWLNSGSEISYSNRFALDNRDVKLTGEAWFQAAKNTEIPMLVNSGEIQIKVVGTQFNVSAYPESGFIDVVLEEGTVQLLNKNVQSSTIFTGLSA